MNFTSHEFYILWLEHMETNLTRWCAYIKFKATHKTLHYLRYALCLFNEMGRHICIPALPGLLQAFSPSCLHWVSGIVAVAWAWRLDSDTFSDLRNGSCDRPLTWLSLVLTDDRHATSSCQLTSGRAKSQTLILTARGGWRRRKEHEEERTAAFLCF